MPGSAALTAGSTVEADAPVPALAGAQEYPPPTDTTVPNSSTTVGASASTVVTSSTTDANSDASTALPFTGGDVVGLITIGIGALGAGYALMRSGTRRPDGAGNKS